MELHWFESFMKKNKENVFLLTGSLAVVRIDDDDSNKKELQAPPDNPPQQMSAFDTSANWTAQGQTNRSTHNEHKPVKKKVRWSKTEGERKKK